MLIFYSLRIITANAAVSSYMTCSVLSIFSASAITSCASFQPQEESPTITPQNTPDTQNILHTCCNLCNLIFSIPPTKVLQKKAHAQAKRGIFAKRWIYLSRRPIFSWGSLFYDGFYTQLNNRYSGILNEKEIQLCCLLKANFSTKEINMLTRQSLQTIYQRKNPFTPFRHNFCSRFCN